VEGLFFSPLTLMLLIGVPAFWSWKGRHAHTVVVNGCVGDAVELRDEPWLNS
jgi:hypothetical protein